MSSQCRTQAYASSGGTASPTVGNAYCFAYTFACASCVTNLSTRVQDARCGMRNFRKLVGSRCKMCRCREHLAHHGSALGAGGPRFESGRPDL